MKTFIVKLYRLLIFFGDLLRHLVLFILRVHFGYQLMRTGWGKLTHLDKTATFFASLNIPMPKVNVILAGSAECFGGALLMIGLASRLVSIPVAFTMAVAYWTAENEAVRNIFSNPDKFTSAAPFLFLLTALLVLTCGPGALSVDALIGRKFSTDKK